MEEFFDASSSMVRRSRFGDYFFADGGPFAPRRGDVVVFRKPGDEGTVYVKRIVGLPGETVQMKAGRLLINGAAVGAPRTARSNCAPGRRARPAPAYVETLPGARPTGSSRRTAGPLDDTPRMSCRLALYLFRDGRQPGQFGRFPHGRRMRGGLGRPGRQHFRQGRRDLLVAVARAAVPAGAIGQKNPPFPAGSS